MVQRPTICHFLAIVVDNKILEGQGRGSIKGLPHPFFLKSTLFTNSGCGKPIKAPPPSSSRILMSIIRAFKWGIICFCIMIGSHSIWRKPKLMLKAYHSNRSPFATVYVIFIKIWLLIYKLVTLILSILIEIWIDHIKRSIVLYPSKSPLPTIHVTLAIGNKLQQERWYLASGLCSRFQTLHIMDSPLKDKFWETATPCEHCISILPDKKIYNKVILDNVTKKPLKLWTNVQTLNIVHCQKVFPIFRSKSMYWHNSWWKQCGLVC